MTGRIYDTPAWKAIRKVVLARDGYRCVVCGKGGQLDVDHIDPHGPAYDPRNLQTICRADHIRKTYAQDRPPIHPRASNSRHW
jgi:5-methylcytosine-specific restriction endonuclease McrA